MKAKKTPSDVWSGEAKHKGCDSVGVLVARSWTHNSPLPIAVLWGSAASQIHIKTVEMDKLLQVEELPSALPGCPAPVEVCHDSVSI